MTPQAIKALQKMLVDAGYDPGPIDGLWGVKTASAVDAYLSQANTVQEFVGDCTSLIIRTAERHNACIYQTAYLLATAEHESGGSMTPNIENLNYSTAQRILAVWPNRFRNLQHAQSFVRKPQQLANHVYNGRMGNLPDSNHGWVFRGRGLVHITGRDGYTRLGQRIGIDLVNNPDRALEPQIATDLLVIGCLEGLYTGLPLNRFVSKHRVDFVGARRVVNGQDCAVMIANLAEKWRKQLL